MVTIDFSLKDLSDLVGSKISYKDMEILVSYLKGEIEDYDKKEGLITIDLDDTNLPFLWSVEGIARLLRGALNKKKKSILKLKSSPHEVIVHPSVIKLRPFTSFLVAKGKPLSDFALKQFIQLQEKLCDSYGKKRKMLSIGLYSFDNIKFPIHFDAFSPNEIKFTPLDFDKKLSLKEIIKTHPKAGSYSFVLKNFKKYPVFIDDNKNVLSLVPIVNSEETGRLKPGDSSFIFEASGTNKETVDLACSIFAYALSDRGYEISSVKVKYPKETIKTPTLSNKSIKVNLDRANSLLGLDLSKKDFLTLLDKADFKFSNNSVLIPDYRADVLHEVDVIEDLAIMHGFNNLKPLGISSHTIGSRLNISNLCNKSVDLLVGAGFQEIISPMLSNKNLLYDLMNKKDIGTIEIKEFMSEKFNVVRTSILPILFEVLSKNKHAGFPQRIFERGLVTSLEKGKAVDREVVSVVIADKSANFLSIKQVLDFLLQKLGFEFSIRSCKNTSFIDSRVAEIIVNKKIIGFVGEVNPLVIKNFDLSVPVSCFELCLSDLPS